MIRSAALMLTWLAATLAVADWPLDAVGRISSGRSGGSCTLIAKGSQTSLVLSCAHVFGSSASATCTFNGAKYSGRRIRMDRGADVSVVVISGVPKAEPLRVADLPLDQSATYWPTGWRKGVLRQCPDSRVVRVTGSRTYLTGKWIIDLGYSGGALLNRRGEVCGVTIAKNVGQHLTVATTLEAVHRELSGVMAMAVAGASVPRQAGQESPCSEPVDDEPCQWLLRRITRPICRPPGCPPGSGRGRGESPPADLEPFVRPGDTPPGNAPIFNPEVPPGVGQGPSFDPPATPPQAQPPAAPPAAPDAGDALKAIVDRLDSLEDRLAAVEERPGVDAISPRLEQVEGTIGVMSKRVEQIVGRMDDDALAAKVAEIIGPIPKPEPLDYDALADRVALRLRPPSSDFEPAIYFTSASGETTDAAVESLKSQRYPITIVSLDARRVEVVDTLPRVFVPVTGVSYDGIDGVNRYLASIR